MHHDNIEKLLNNLNTDKDKGLTKEEAEKRLKEYGYNKLNEKKKKSFFLRFLLQFKDIMVIILIIAAFISLGITIYENVQHNWNNKKEFIEPCVIFFIVILNAILGMFQESKAEKALDALKKMSAPFVKVIRNSEQIIVKSEEIVPGDIIVLEAGDVVPADCRLVSSASLICEESSLTGESVPVYKDHKLEIEENAALGDRKNCIYSGSYVNYGRATAVVVNTAMNTEIGKIATMLNDEKETLTPLQLKLVKLGKILAIAASLICIIVFIVGTATGKGDIKRRLIETFMVAISLAVAAIPEGLPAIITVLLAMGVEKMAKKNCIVRKLPAVETLGSASIICSDKTGTLTQNKMTITHIYNMKNIIEVSKNLEGKNLDIIKYSLLCSDANITFDKDKKEDILMGDPTEICIVQLAKENQIIKDNFEEEHKRLYELPFDSDRKLMTTINNFDGKNLVITKGAFDSLKNIASNSKEEIKELEKAVNNMAENALRVLAVAIKIVDKIPNTECDFSLENNLKIIGLLGMIDPPREEVKDAVLLCSKAGIKTIMITGDHVITAKKIAEDLNIYKDGDMAITGQELKSYSDEELLEKIDKITVYARVSPEDKIRIVKAWQAKDQVVVMTGDGVNDSPALKAADIGCAMGITGTEVSKSASKMTLMDDNFTTIVHAVQEGRNIYRNIKKSIQFLLSCNIGEIIAVFVAMLAWKTSPLLAMQLLWINLLTDSFPALALGIDKSDKSLMYEKPRNKRESIFANGMGINILINGAIFGLITLIAFTCGYYMIPNSTANVEYQFKAGRTMAFAVLSASQLFYAFDIKAGKNSIFTKNAFNNKLLIISFIISILIIVGTLFIDFLSNILELTRLTPTLYGIIVLLSITPTLLSEVQILFQKIYKRIKNGKQKI